MTQLIVDAVTVACLERAAHPVELVDASGRKLGQFIPASSVLRLQPLISAEEMDRREKQGGGRALSEILADLEKRA